MGSLVLKFRRQIGSTLIIVIKIILKIMLRCLPVKQILKRELEKSDIFINLDPAVLTKIKETNPKAINLKIHREDAYLAFAGDPMYDALESFINGGWECDELEELFSRAMCLETFYTPVNLLLTFIDYNLMKNQGLEERWEVGRKHYDLGNEQFEKIIGPTMAYSCGYWKDTTDKDEAQLKKIDLIARKLHLRPGMRVLDIGCGWGALAKYLAENYDVQVVGLTNSVEGGRFCQKFCKGLSVEIRVQDYEAVDELFDRIVCVEMMEHIGPKNYRSFHQLVHRCLQDDGLFLLQVTTTDNKSAQYSRWINDRLIPLVGSPTQLQVIGALNGLFTIEDLQNIGLYFRPTWIGWRDTFCKTWPQLKHLYPESGEQVYRRWFLYFTICAAIFGVRGFHMWQVVTSKDGKRRKVYESVR